MPLIGAIDSGTTSSRFMLFDTSNLSRPLHKSQHKHKTYYPRPGYVEHDAEEILANTAKCIDEVAKQMNQTGDNSPKVAAIGITNQRETTVLWDANTGKVLGRSLVWNDTRTKTLVEKLRETNPKETWDEVRKKSGLSLATYFSGIKLRWLLNKDRATKEALKEKRVMFGTIDSWLIWNLTGGVNGGAHVTDVTNASRTMLMNLQTLQWDKSLFDALGIPFEDGIQFPEIKSCAEVYGTLSSGPLKGVPIAGCAGDQQAALIGQRCFSSGETKCTYGTGCFMVMNTGDKLIHSTHGLLTTMAYQFGSNSKPQYALEGSVANAGSSIEWIKNNMQLISDVSEIEQLVNSVHDSGDVYFVPAFSGLFAPYWRADARGTIVGMTLFTEKAHIVRALLESICFQNEAVLSSMVKDSQIEVPMMKVDGGMTQNDTLMQIQSNIMNTRISRPHFMELTVAGASICAGLGVGLWKDVTELPKRGTFDVFEPSIETDKRKRMLEKWALAVEKSCGWEEDEDEE
eukprot:CAMPEP_0117437158 /NCGR_PEP_ID=MMETSP0759-20121206/1380_1 /TAXON_ID=63605 /ORGANISM="Percolomonas cosmopolitus, Strain WS" /LENGTH=514 /DNA_ID=CAMNT_0005228783 /DNA_START=484 /DNA_END=2028 /DNA_ORIENTATION=-